MNVYNNVFLERDIWPVSPFQIPSFYEYSQGLPPQFRDNKNALRAFHAASGFPAGIYNASGSESFHPFFQRTMRQEPIERTIQHFASKSALKRHGYLDSEALLGAYHAAQQDDSGDAPWLFHIYSWLCIEIHLMHTPLHAV